MRGHIKKLYKSSYTIVVPLGRDPATGKYRQHWENVKGTKADAERRLSELQNELYKGTFIKPQKITVAEYLTDWLENTARFHVSPTTYKGYKHIINRHLIPGIGGTYLSNLTGVAIQTYYAQKLKSPCLDSKSILSSHSVRCHHKVLHRALKSAVVKRIIMHNVADDTEPPIPVKKEVRPMTESQLTLFLQELKGSHYYEIFYLFLFTGLRRSELFALHWDDIDLQNKRLTVSRSLHYINREFIFSEPKTEKSKATISLTNSTVKLMEDYKHRKIAEYILLGKKFSGTELVFCRSNGKPFIPQAASEYWRRFADRLGMTELRLHDARHTHASLMLRRGVNVKIIQERLRHADIKTTLNIYSHILQGMHDEAASLFDEYAPK